MKIVWLALLSLLVFCPAVFADDGVGVFETHGDVGKVLHPGTVQYDPSAKTYTLAASGTNMWFKSDEFQFVWKKVSGDVSLAADVAFADKTGNEHKKAALIIRQTLDPDSPYVDVAFHGNGLTALQYRESKGALTQEVQSHFWGAKGAKLIKRGDTVYLMLSPDGGPLQITGASTKIAINGDYYVGIGMCAHDPNDIQKAVFSNVSLVTKLPAASSDPKLYSTLETIAVSSTDRQVVYVAQGRFEAPNWTRDGKNFIFNRNGHLERIPVKGGTPEIIDTGFADRCNNDHGISPDGTMLAISDGSQEDHKSIVYTLPITGGTPKRITQKSPSYWHGWSPDGKTLAFVSQRDGEFDIYSIPVEGGDETRLTKAKGLDDGPEYSPDGKYIYFNSERTGHMQIWRMHPDGSEQEQITFGEGNDWFPHISPDGQSMVFLTYGKEVTGHPENKDVMLRVMNFADKQIKVIAKLFGGQGTINVPSWSPDSKQVAFVSYQLVAEEAQK